jgi:hypothetical protein
MPGYGRGRLRAGRREGESPPRTEDDGDGASPPAVTVGSAGCRASRCRARVRLNAFKDQLVAEGEG